MALEFVRCKACGKPQRSDRTVCASCGADVLTGIRSTAGNAHMGETAAEGNSESRTRGLFQGYGYIEQNLMPGEKVVYQTRLHYVVFVGPAIVSFVALSAAMKAFGVEDNSGVALFFLVLAVLVVLPSFASYLTSEFGISSDRVLVKVGFIRRRSLEILLTKVEGVVLDQSILGRILGYGTVVVIGTGGTKEPLDRIDAPLEFRKQLQEQIALIHGQKEGAGP